MNESTGVTTFGTIARSQAVPPASDEEIAATGGVASFERLYERHLEVVYRYVAGRVATREEAEDVTSDAFQRAWAGLVAYRGNGTFKAWLFGIVRHALADHYRRPRLSRFEPNTAETLADEQPGPEERAIDGERQQQARQLLATLKREQQEVLHLRFVAELTYAEIAQVVGKREEAVKKIAYRALAEIKRRQIE
jgi:RNA polymerase sigma-70 factor (ECF subfamily)